MIDYRQQQPQGMFFPPVFPGQPGGQQSLNRRVNELERQVRQLEREQNRLDRRLTRLENMWFGSPSPRDEEYYY